MISGWKLHLNAYFGKRTEPISRKFGFLSLGNGLIRSSAGPLMRVIRKRILGGEILVVMFSLYNVWETR